MEISAGGIAALISALVVGIPAAVAGWRALRRSIRADMEQEDALKTAQNAVKAKNAEITAKDAVIAEKDRTIAELMAMLDDATRPGRAR